MYKLSKQERDLREKMRGKYPLDSKWYAVMTHCGREHEVGDRILLDYESKGVEEVLLPELKANASVLKAKRRRPELLFFCYVFVRCQINDDIYMRVSAYDGVQTILGRAYRIPSVIEDTEMTYLKGVLESHPAPSLSPRLNIGAEAVVTGGLMEGMRGRVVEFNSHFVKLETCFSFFDNGTSIVVHVPMSRIRLDETGLFRIPRRPSDERIQIHGG